MYKSNFIAFLLFIISFLVTSYIINDPLYLHPVILLFISWILIVGSILFSDFHDPTDVNSPTELER